jgi:hypothetical protein
MVPRPAKLGNLQHPAAYDNAGGILYHKKNYSAAVAQFQLGVQHGDADSMVSLAEMVKQGRAPGNYMLLLEEAARRGHEGAQQTLQQEQQRQVELQQQQQAQFDQQRRAVEILGGILRSIPAR